MDAPDPIGTVICFFPGCGQKFTGKLAAQRFGFHHGYRHGRRVKMAYQLVTRSMRAIKLPDGTWDIRDI